jgi:hypothetical protein
VKNLSAAPAAGEPAETFRAGEGERLVLRLRHI